MCIVSWMKGWMLEFFLSNVVLNPDLLTHGSGTNTDKTSRAAKSWLSEISYLICRVSAEHERMLNFVRHCGIYLIRQFTFNIQF